MLRRIPVLPTLVVLIAVAVMVRLGFWQIDRLHQKEAMLARYGQAQAMSSDVPWPSSPAAIDRALYRHSHIDCANVVSAKSVSGRNAKDEAGWAHVAHCALRSEGEADVVLGWSNNPAVPVWQGGEVAGFVAPGPRLIASPPLAGLVANAVPDPSDIPNNHFAYAIQWFLFALTALVIYALALRKRLAGGEPPR
jgi:surfeit locus 1 family protein